MVNVDKALRNQGFWLDGVAPLRVVIVATLFGYQSLEVSENFGRLAGSPIWILPATLVAALFAIAGFVLSQSLERIGMRGFLWRRFRRGWPILAVVVVLSALVIGPLATDERLGDYFIDRDFATYFLNLAAVPMFRLPGVFTTNFVVATVNDILWAVPFCVAAVAILAAVSLLRRHTALALAVIAAALTAVAMAVALLGIVVPGNLSALRWLVAGKGLTTLLCFLLGALAYHLRRRLVINHIVAAAAALAIAAASILGQRVWGETAVFNVLIAVPLTYLVIVLALSPLPLAGPANAVQKYLWGFVLFSYPVQQSIVATGLVGYSFPVILAVSLPVTGGLAGVAWHLVQRRFAGQSSIEPSLDTGGAATPSFSVGQIWQRTGELVPELALWLAFVIITLVTIAMTMFAFTPEKGGI